MINQVKMFEDIESKEWLKSVLKERPVKVTFIKTDGTEREMLCTLEADKIVPHEKKTDRVKAINEEVLSVWDLEKEQWRSFRFDKIKQFSFELKGE
jgi:hypothetical protein